MLRKAIQFVQIVISLVYALTAIGAEQNSSTTQSTKQVALVIGNANYAMSPLKNPTNDSKDFAAKLKQYGFDVVYRENLRITQVGSMLREFKSKLTPGATALVFYAGHGLQMRGENYFPVVDADITTEEDIPIQSLALHQLMDILEEAKTGANIVILDACRNNPFDRRTRSLSRGLAKVNSPSGTLIAYSTRPGSVAQDGDGRNGLYTDSLLKMMDTHKPIEQVLKQMVSSIKAASKGSQEPWSEGSLEGDFCFGGCADENADKAKLLSEVTLWQSVLNTSKIDDYKNYIQQYPNGTFVAVAKKMIASLEIQSTSSAAQSEIDMKRKENESLLKQAESIKQKELERLEFEKNEKEKLLAAIEEKLKQEAQNRSNLEEELKKARLESEALKSNASTNTQNETSRKKELDQLAQDKLNKEKILAATEEKLRQEAASRSALEDELKRARTAIDAAKGSQNLSSDAPPKKIFISPVF